jgi:hypothetical protein
MNSVSFHLVLLQVLTKVELWGPCIRSFGDCSRKSISLVTAVQELEFARAGLDFEPLVPFSFLTIAQCQKVHAHKKKNALHGLTPMHLALGLAKLNKARLAVPSTNTQF